MARAPSAVSISLAAFGLLAIRACTLGGLDDLKQGTAGPDAGGFGAADAQGDSSDGSGGEFVDASCFDTCTLPNADTASCKNGTCVIDQCKTGWADCDGIVEDGCEAHVASDPANCGSCGTKCIASDGTAVCSGGSCSLSCPAGRLDCNGLVDDGCEVEPAWDGTHCGGCSNGCADGEACANGQCAASSCASSEGVLFGWPNADLDTGLWAASPGPPFYANVDEQGADDGTASYIWDDTSIDWSHAVFAHTSISLPAGHAISNVIVVARASQAPTATVPTNLTMVVRPAQIEFQSNVIPFSGMSFQSVSASFPTNPESGAAWTESDLASLGFGIAHKKPVTTSDVIQVTQVVLQVCVH